MQLRDYQESISTDAAALLRVHKIAYLSMEVRTGKTLTALSAAEKYGATWVLFLTKKKAISDITKAYNDLSPAFKLICTNYEQIYTLSPDYKYDFIILDEAHGLGQYPTPAERTKELRRMCVDKPIIYLSGTPTPESFSQLFHQLWVSSFSPFKEYASFYKWAKDFVTVKKRYYYNREINDYSQANKEKVEQLTKHLFISYTQSEAGFEQEVKEVIVKVPMQKGTYWLTQYLRKHRVYIGKDGQEILADTEIKLLQKTWQMFSGTVIAENGDAICFDHSKAKYIKDNFSGKKIAIFYVFKAEYTMLLWTFGYDKITDDPEVFNNSTDKVFISQIQSGAMGVNLSTADCMIMFNIHYSNMLYWQVRARMQDKNRTKEPIIYWLFAEAGIEEKIYQAVIDKRDYVLSYFRKDYEIKKKYA